MTRVRSTVAMAFLLLTACGERPAPELVVIRASELVDGTGTAPRNQVRITIRKGLIESVVDDNDVLPAPTGAAVIDARGLTVMPGFIATYSLCAADALRDSTKIHQAMLMGVTTAEVVSADLGRTIALRTYIESRRDRGPRIIAGDTIVSGNSQGQTLRAKVRNSAEAGAEIVHVPLVGNSETTREALCALVDEAHAQDMRSMIEVDSSAHFEEARACNAETIVWHATGIPTVEPEPLREAPEVVIDADATAALAWEKVGALLAFTSNGASGDDSCILLSSRTGEVIDRLVSGGMNREHAIAAFTSGAARTLGLGDAIGRVAPGYRADLLITEPRGTGAIRHVFIDGKEQSLEAPNVIMRWAAWWALR